MLLDAGVHMCQRMYILLLSSVVTCPSMTMLFRGKLETLVDRYRRAGHAGESVGTSWSLRQFEHPLVNQLMRRRGRC